MTISALQTLIEGNLLTPSVQTDKLVTSGYVCDLLSWVMSHGEEGMAWVTVQTHMNVIAVAVLAEMACVILPENIRMEPESLEKAEKEGMAVLSSPLSAYAISGLMWKAGVPEKA